MDEYSYNITCMIDRLYVVPHAFIWCLVSIKGRADCLLLVLLSELISYSLRWLLKYRFTISSILFMLRDERLIQYLSMYFYNAIFNRYLLNTFPLRQRCTSQNTHAIIIHSLQNQLNILAAVNCECLAITHRCNQQNCVLMRQYCFHLSVKLCIHSAAAHSCILI